MLRVHAAGSAADREDHPVGARAVTFLMGPDVGREADARRAPFRALRGASRPARASRLVLPNPGSVADLTGWGWLERPAC